MTSLKTYVQWKATTCFEINIWILFKSKCFNACLSLHSNVYCYDSKYIVCSLYYFCGFYNFKKSDCARSNRTKCYIVHLKVCLKWTMPQLATIQGWQKNSKLLFPCLWSCVLKCTIFQLFSSQPLLQLSNFMAFFM